MNIQEITIKVPWGSIKAQLFGNASLKNVEPILCMHGYLDNSNSFKPLAHYLTNSNKYYLISIDLPGHGFSSKLPDGIPYTQKLLINCLRRVIRDLNLKRFYFLCHSFGVYLSLLVYYIF